MRVLKFIGIMSVLFVLPLMALEKTETGLPDNFGTDEWAVNNWEEALRYMKYVAGLDIQQRFIVLPEDRRLEAWHEYWVRFDPEINTPENEYKDAYFTKIRLANERYSTQKQEGWLTDRGEVYIRMGRPDNVERYEMKSGEKELTIWEYGEPLDKTFLFTHKTTEPEAWVLLNPDDLADHVYLHGNYLYDSSNKEQH